MHIPPSSKHPTHHNTLYNHKQTSYYCVFHHRGTTGAGICTFADKNFPWMFVRPPGRRILGRVG